MKVLDLCCSQGHGFEGWFSSEDDYASQLGRGLIGCPLCADTGISRRPSAPRLNLSGARAPSPSSAEAAAKPAAAPPLSREKALQAAWMQAVRHVIAHTEDVGERFPEEARRMHYGEIEARGIRGQASPEQREALLDEGIEIASLPMPQALKEPLQ
ncbi:DUF1178 family protein [Aquincola tertiaricarbonis]|uniref:DUF1178 family protein n=1 Tax=Aquincola tertiaricarbonis TaxID=391953 RepID=UPI0006152715|nr:DUF1178 family protein [Aquincola tertiaricarbonis]